MPSENRMICPTDAVVSSSATSIVTTTLAHGPKAAQARSPYVRRPGSWLRHLSIIHAVQSVTTALAVKISSPGRSPERLSARGMPRKPMPKVRLMRLKTVWGVLERLRWSSWAEVRGYSVMRWFRRWRKTVGLRHHRMVSGICQPWHLQQATTKSSQHWSHLALMAFRFRSYMNRHSMPVVKAEKVPGGSAGGKALILPLGNLQLDSKNKRGSGSCCPPVLVSPSPSRRPPHLHSPDL